MKDVAQAAQVSVGTVSNVLNRPDRVTPFMRARVQEVIAELGFVRNESARQLRAGTSRTLAYVMLDARNPFFTDVAQGIEHAAEALGLTVVLCNSGNVAAREEAHLALTQEQRLHGVLVTPMDPHAPILDELRRHRLPLVIVDRTRDDNEFCTVAVDDVLGGRLAVEHLIDRGHHRVAFVGGPPQVGQVRDRLQGARQAWQAAGRPAEDLVVLTTDALDVAGGASAGQRLAGLSVRRRPTAAFCANDLLALGLLQQAMSTGTSVPDDLAIIGYDDIDFAAAAAVPLSSVRQPRHDLGRTAAEMVVDEATNDSHEHRQVLFTPELVARASTTG
nr:LacI family DNA-binding transcriptional regulator [uncultured Nocardioides sp.]